MRVRAEFELSVKASPWKAPFCGKHGPFSCKEMKAYQAEVRYMLNQLYRDAPIAGPVELDICFQFRQAKSNRSIHHLQRPDVTNLLKNIEDCMTGIVFYDDKQVIGTRVSKQWGAADVINITVFGE